MVQYILIFKKKSLNHTKLYNSFPGEHVLWYMYVCMYVRVHVYTIVIRCTLLFTRVKVPSMQILWVRWVLGEYTDGCKNLTSLIWQFIVCLLSNDRNVCECTLSFTENCQRVEHWLYLWPNKKKKQTKSSRNNQIKIVICESDCIIFCICFKPDELSKFVNQRMNEVNCDINH